MFTVLAKADMDVMLSKQSYMIPLVYKAMSVESFFAGASIFPDCGLPTEDMNPLIFFCLSLRFVGEFKKQCLNLIASLLVHGYYSSDLVSKDVLSFTKSRELKNLFKSWKQQMLVYCLVQKRAIFF